MAELDSAVLVPGTGNYFHAPVGTATPTDLFNPTAGGWTSFGHTSLEDIFALDAEGGEAVTIGTLQKKALRTSYSPRTEKVTFTLQQFDRDSLRHYFGRNMVELPQDSRFLGVPQTPQPTRSAFLVVLYDGERAFSIYAPDSEIMRNDNLEIADTESPAGLPLGVTPMAYTNPQTGVSNDWAWAISPVEAAPDATGATAGKPGSFTPAGAARPDNITLLDTVTASPTTKWTAGNYVVLGNGREVFWDGTAWTNGRAV